MSRLNEVEKFILEAFNIELEIKKASRIPDLNNYNMQCYRLESYLENGFESYINIAERPKPNLGNLNKFKVYSQYPVLDTPRTLFLIRHYLNKEYDNIYRCYCSQFGVNGFYGAALSSKSMEKI